MGVKILGLYKFYQRFIFALVLEQLLYFLTQVSALFLTVLFLSYFNQSNIARSILIYSFYLTAAALLLSIIIRLKKQMNLADFCALLENRYPNLKNSLSALELCQNPPRSGISESMREAFILKFQQEVHALDPKMVFRLAHLNSKMRPMGFIFILLILALFVPPRLGLSAWQNLFTDPQTRISDLITITPQGGTVNYGDIALVSIHILKPLAYQPKLFVESLNGNIEIPAKNLGDVLKFEIGPVIQKIDWFVDLNNIKTGYFAFTPIEPCRLKNFKVIITAPSYTSKRIITITGEPNIQLLRGSIVKILANATKPLQSIEMVTSIGQRFPVRITNESSIEITFSLKHDLEFWFEMVDKSGRKTTENVHYSAFITEDHPPEVRLLSPAGDILTSKDTEIPITCELSDDFGIQSVYAFVKYDKSSVQERVLLNRFDPAISESIHTVPFFLSSIHPQPGDTLSFKVEVRDNDTISGPKSAFSNSIHIEIEDYEKSHSSVEDSLKTIQNQFLELVAQQSLALLPEGVPPIQKSEEVIREQSEVIERTKGLESDLQSILKKIEQDPLSDYMLWSEHQSIRKGLHSLREGSMKQSQEDLLNKNWQRAREKQEETLTELERLSSLSEECLRDSKMNDLVRETDRLMQKGEDLSAKLSKAQSLDAALARELEEAVKEADSILSHIKNQIKNLPQDYPEDFINRKAVKTLNLNEIQKSAQELSDSLRNGDLKSALDSARKFLDSVKNARDILAKAKNETELNQGESLKSEIDQQAKELDNIIDEQERILKRTSVHETKRSEKSLKKQRDFLLVLAKKQREAVENTTNLLKSMQENLVSHQNFIFLVREFEQSLPKMTAVLNEMEEGNILFSQKLLNEIIAQLGGAAEKIKMLETEMANHFYPRIDQIKKTEEFILESLKNPSLEDHVYFSQEDEKELKKLADDQNTNVRQTMDMQKKLSKVAKRSAAFNQTAIQSIKNAVGEMNSSALSLSKNQTSQAQSTEQKALSYLRDAQNSISSSREEFSRGLSIVQKKGTERLIIPKNQSGGRMGFKTGEVHIPTADDYLPPRQFREELLESLKEKYPEADEKIIKDYYKRLSQ